ncbi:MAG: mannose-6-phosphate isomerase, class I [Streptococcaceae bacterium]|jgi:mannose-6-phosphate isomerase|nr:mannose-6-phosphate isomerase, class I [Streptococcaceae bacterium]
MFEPLFLDSVLQEKIWGGKKLETVFGYPLTSEKTGEYWAISAHPHGVSTINNGEFKGMKLDELWKNHKELFGNAEGEVFPLLTKILDANDWLSVQVHPDDAYGKAHAGELGKTECWYILDAEPGSEIIYGHHAKTREELRNMIEAGRWDDLLTRVKVKTGDFFYVPSGTMHAIGSGILILETQQSSDTTYRVYDFDRVDDAGQARELHIEESIDVMKIPGTTEIVEEKVQQLGRSNLTTFVETEFFNVYKWEIQAPTDIETAADYSLVSIIEGRGTLEIEGQTWKIEKGNHFILPYQVNHVKVNGEFEAIVSTPGK